MAKAVSKLGENKKVYRWKFVDYVEEKHRLNKIGKLVIVLVIINTLS